MRASKKTLPLVLLLIVLVIAVGVGGGCFLWYWSSGHTVLPTTRTDTVTTDAPVVSTPTEEHTTVTTAALVDNPVDFTTLQAVNSDIYAWLYVPNTNIDYPVAQSSAESDSFYLEHNIYKEYEFAGTIYSEKQNSRDFSDRMTVLYGHNMLNGTMFRTLHYFEDADFFNDNPYFYIYTPGHILTYTVFAAYEYDDRHLLNSFNFQDDTVWANYLAFATNPKSMNVLTREVSVTTADTVVTLSTCVGYDGSARYLVQGVLTNDQLTK